MTTEILSLSDIANGYLVEDKGLSSRSTTYAKDLTGAIERILTVLFDLYYYENTEPDAKGYAVPSDEWVEVLTGLEHFVKNKTVSLIAKWRQDFNESKEEIQQDI